MPNQTLRTLLPIAGWSGREVTFSGGTDPVLPTPFRVGVAGATTLISTCGCTLPIVAVRRSRSSSLRVWQETGDVSVIP